MPSYLYLHRIYKVGILLISLICLANQNVFSQLDDEFWFVAPAVTINHSATSGCSCASNGRCGASPTSFNIANFDTVNTTVRIEMPANSYDVATNPNGFTPIIVDIAPNTTERVQLWGPDPCQTADSKIRKLVENRFDPSSPTDTLQKGIHITATNYVTVYYEVEETNNSDIYALKGANALGDEFFVPFQKNKENVSMPDEQTQSSIDFVAVDPGITTVWVYPTDSVIGWGKPDSFKINLNQGETYSVVPGVFNSGAGEWVVNRQPGNHLAGTRLRVEGGKRIAVTISDDSVRGDSGCYDLIGDQLIPIEVVNDNGTRDSLIGTEYIVMKGALGWNKSGTDYDRIYIVATKDSTDVTVKDITNSLTYNYNNLMSQQQQTHVIPFESNTSLISYVSATKPVYVFHVSGAGGGCEIGGSILPSVSQCTGSFNVGFSRGSSTGKTFLLNVMVREINPGDPDSVRYAFKLNGNPSLIDGDEFVNIPGTPWWAAQFQINSIATGSSNILSNSKNIFHLGTLNGGATNGGNYGYFSNYSSIEARSYVSGVGQPGIKLCWGETAQLIAEGGLFYEWIPGTYLSDSLAQRPYTTPLTDIKYNVIVKGASCSVPDTAEILVLVSDTLSAEFDVDNKFGCSPVTVNITNKSYGTGISYYWYLDDVYFSKSQNPSALTLYNNTDTAIDYTIELLTAKKSCFKRFSKVIRVYPNVTAGFDQDTVAGCHPLEIQFTDTSSGNTFADGYLWDFGDNSSSDSANPINTFQNIGTDDTTYTVQLVTTSPFLCTDTAEVDILVHPVVKASVAIDSTFSCSPMDIEFDPLGSVNALNLNYSFSSSSFVDSVHTTTSKSPLRFYHNDATQGAPDTVMINFWVENKEGCFDTIASSRQLIIFPEVHAIFNIDTNAICDSLPIDFTNNSVGFNLASEWDFGNGNSKFDSTNNNYTEVYRNRGSIDSIYAVNLRVTSDYNSSCYDEMDTTITVHPFIRSLFTMDYSDNCSPIDATLYNVSQGATSYNWNFGDGNTSTSATPTLSKTFTNPSTSNDTSYTITLIATKNTCSDTTSRTINLTPQVIAAFSPDIIQGCQPLSVTFTNTSTGAANYNWEFGDSVSLSINNNTAQPHTYDNLTGVDKNYIVTLTATNNQGCDSIITDTIEVYSYVKANYTLDAAMECSPFTLNTNNNSSIAGTLTYEWDFGDGRPTSALEDPDPTYINQTDTIQEFTLKLTAENNNNCQSVKERVVTIYPEVVADFTTSDGLYENCEPYEVTFVNNSNVPASFYLWDFDKNGAFSALNNPIYTYTNTGEGDSTFSVNLYAESDWGCSDDTTIDITAYAKVISNFIVDNAENCSPFPISITNLSSIGVKNYDWTFGDGASSAVKTPTHTYVNQGTSTRADTLQLIAWNNHAQCTDTFSQIITIHPEVIADFTTSDGIYVNCEPFTVNFVNNSNAPAQSFVWDFDKSGASSSATSPTFTFTNTGPEDSTYNVNLYAESAYGCSDDTTIDITTYAKVIANFVLDNSESCSPFSIGITNLSSQGVKNYAWSFGDGSPISNIKTPSHTYVNQTLVVNNNTLQLIAWNNHAQCTDTFKRIVTIYPEVVADFTTSDGIYANCEPFTVSFVNNSNSPAQTFVWDFDKSGASSSATSPIYNFTNTGPEDSVYSVNLYAESAYGCSDDTTIDITTYAKVIASFVLDKSEQCSPFSIAITNLSSQGTKNYAWSFGDGDSDTLKTPTHIYVNKGLTLRNDVLQLIAWNNHAQCADTFKRIVTSYPEMIASFTPDKLAGCEPLSISFSNNTNIKTGTIYEWSFDDGTFSTSETPSTHTYSNTQSNSVFKNIELDVESQHGCTDDTTIQIEIYAYIFAKFVIDKPNACSGELFAIDRNASKGDLDDFNWNYNGELSNNESDAQFSFNFVNTSATPSNKLITLTVFNSNGCDTSWTEDILIYPQVTANFAFDDDAPCYPHNTTITNISNYASGVAKDFYWDFGDKSSSGDLHPIHFFNNFSKTADSIYNVKLTASSDYECSAETTKTITIHPKPKANFSAENSVGCPPFIVDFENLSEITNPIYFWDFKNGNTSTTTNPSEMFNNIGSTLNDFDVQLIANTAFGCSDTISKTIRVYPLVTANFDASNWEDCNPLTVDFTGTVTNYDELIWDFDDDGSSVLLNPSHRFVNKQAINDTFNVELVAISKYNCSDTVNKDIVVYPNPIAEFSPEPILQDFNMETDITNVTIQNLTQHQSSWEYEWNFGDGTTGTQKNGAFTKAYMVWGDINDENKLYITLTALNKAETDCKHSKTVEIIINPPSPQIDLKEDIAGCEPFTVDFAASVKYGYDDGYRWEFGYNNKTSTNVTPTFTYDTSGVYIAKLFVEGDGGVKWDYKKITVYPKPRIDFAFRPEIVLLLDQKDGVVKQLLSEPIQFYNQTLDAVSYEWDFGDGETSTKKEPQHRYTNLGEYYVTLVATSENECESSYTHETPVLVDAKAILDYPNAFIPSLTGPTGGDYDPDDINNSVFRPNSEGVSEYYLEIYTRWGELVFSTSSLKKGWDGYINGKLAKQDVYIWRVKGKYTNGKPFIKAGDVTLISYPSVQ